MPRLQECLVLLRVAIFVAAWIAMSVAARGQTSPASFTFPGQAKTSDVVERLMEDAADGRLDRHDLFDAALIAGGTTDARRRAAYRGAFDRLVGELRVSGRIVGNELQRARSVHEFLHGAVFTSFCETCTTLDDVFEHGRFNCISSVILFRCLGERFGLKVSGIEVPGHAYAVVESAAGPIVVQTTCAEWFAVRESESGRRALLTRTLGATAAATADRRPADGRTLSDVALTAIVAYNRGLDHLEAGRFAESLAANRTALDLDSQNRSARANWLATLNNWSLDQFRRGDVGQSLALLEQGLAAAPDYALFYENAIAVHQQSLARPTAPGKMTTGKTAAEHRAALSECYRRWQTAMKQSGATAEAERIASRAAVDPFLRSTP